MGRYKTPDGKATPNSTETTFANSATYPKGQYPSSSGPGANKSSTGGDEKGKHQPPGSKTSLANHKRDMGY